MKFNEESSNGFQAVTCTCKKKKAKKARPGQGPNTSGCPLLITTLC